MLFLKKFLPWRAYVVSSVRFSPFFSSNINNGISDGVYSSLDFETVSCKSNSSNLMITDDSIRVKVPHANFT